jgi:pyridoxamine---pyruvate transaminase
VAADLHRPPGAGRPRVRAASEPVFTLTPGPAGATAPTLAALGRPLLHHLDPAFRELYAETVQLLRAAFGVRPSPVILPGEAVAGLEAAAASLIRADDVVLNLVSGPYGAAFGALARRHAAEVVEVRVPYDSTVASDEVRAALSRRPDVAIVSVVHCETPAGTVNDLDAIARVVAEHGALLVVDAVATFAGQRCDITGWQADLVVAAPQKCLGGPPGLSLLHVSDEAWRHMKGNPTAPRSSVLSILDWRGAAELARPFPYTPPVSEIFALHACLGQYLAEGPAAVWARHSATARAVRAGTEALGLRLWAASPGTCADTVTAVRVPGGVDAAELRAVARAESGVMLSGGQPELGGQVVQIAHMGPSAYPLSPVIAVTALGHALRRLGADADIGRAVEAAVATWPVPDR